MSSLVARLRGAVTRPPAGEAPGGGEAALATPTRRPLWQLLNEPREVDATAVRVCCIVLTVAFGAIITVRTLETGGSLHVLPRAALIAYALFGAVAGPHLKWRGLRAYTVGLTIALPITAFYVIGMDRFPPSQVLLCALATFVPFIFLLTGRDFLIALPLLIGVQLMVQPLFPDPLTPRWIVAVTLAGAMACGTAAGILLVSTRGLVAESRGWWQASHRRERILRKFAEAAASSTPGVSGLPGLAAAMTGAAPGSICALVFERDRGSLQVVTSVASTDAAPSTLEPGTPAIAAYADGAMTATRTHRDLSARAQDELVAFLGLDLAQRPGGMAVLPLGAVVRGFVVVLVPDQRKMTPDVLELLEAMRFQAANAVMSALSWEALRDREVETRRLAEERLNVAELRARFVTQASHEFRTPLAVIRATTEALDRYETRLTPVQRRDKLLRVRTAVDQMTLLLDDVLMLGSVEAQARSAERETTDLVALCRSVLAEARESALPTHRLRLQCSERHLWLPGSPVLLRSMVGNLLSNAIKYSPQGGPIDLSLARRRDGAIVLRVRDRGIGIPADDAAQLFESFRRAKNVGSIPGSGLGLAIVQRGVEAHGATIRVESELGAGTTIEVVLPDAWIEQPRGGSARNDEGAPRRRAGSLAASA